MIDSHCHLADPAFADDLEAVIGRARAAGLERALVVLEAGNDGEAERARRIDALWPAVRLAVGVHPHQAGRFADDPRQAAAVVRRQALATPQARAIGEIGLDYHYDFAPRAVQREVFRVQIALARELGWPVVIHTREADEDTLAILGEPGAAGVSGVLHCFTGTADLARAALDLGFYISAAGIVTFPKAGALREVLKAIPPARLLAETDSPFLAPVPFRGTRNEPSRVVKVVEKLAELHAVDAVGMAASISTNFHALFRP